MKNGDDIQKEISRSRRAKKRLENITFRNISVHSAQEGVYACRMHYSAECGGFKDIRLENVEFRGEKMSQSHKNDPKLFCNEAPAFFDQLTVE